MLLYRAIRVVQENCREFPISHIVDAADAAFGEGTQKENQCMKKFVPFFVELWNPDHNIVGMEHDERTLSKSFFSKIGKKLKNPTKILKSVRGLNKMTGGIAGAVGIGAGGMVLDSVLPGPLGPIGSKLFSNVAGQAIGENDTAAGQMAGGGGGGSPDMIGGIIGGVTKIGGSIGKHHKKKKSKKSHKKSHGHKKKSHGHKKKHHRILQMVDYQALDEDLDNFGLSEREQQQVTQIVQ